jgi:hypothetical protein
MSALAPLEAVFEATLRLHGPGVTEAPDFLARLLRRLRLHALPDGPYAGERPLARASLEGPDNWLLALLESWSMVGEIVCFYQQRLAEEGYLPSAQDQLSIHELIRLLGFPPRPGVASNTWVAYTLGGAKGTPEQVQLPPGALIQSVPLNGQLPQTYELDAALLARVEWNQLTPEVASTTVTAPLGSAATRVELAGLRSNLKPGAELLLLGTLDGVPRRAVRPVEKVEAQGTLADGTTLVSWSEPLGPSTGELAPPRPLADAQAFNLRRAARLFGYNAPDWSKQPLAAQRAERPILGGLLLSTDRGATWQGENDGLPATAIHALFATPANELLAGTQEGLYALVGTSWQARTQGLSAVAITALGASTAGTTLFAGTSDGRVMRSTDGGVNWENLQGSTASSRPSTLRRLVPASLEPPPAQTRLPRSPVRALAWVGGEATVLAGGGSGAWSLAEPDRGWQPRNRGLPGTDPKSGAGAVTVSAIAEASDGLWLGTDQGVFTTEELGRSWRAASDGLPGHDAKTGKTQLQVLSLVTWEDRRQRQRWLFAGTEKGVFRKLGNDSWRSANVGLPAQDPLARTATVAVAALATAWDAATLTLWLFAGTDQGLFRSADLGSSWIPLPTGQPTEAVSALATGSWGVAAATPFDGFAAAEWPGFALSPGAVDLATTVDAVAGSWIALTQAASGEAGGAAPPPPQILQVREVTLVRRNAFGLSALVSRLEVDPSVDLSAFDLRNTIVLYDSQSLPLATREVPVLRPFGGATLELAGVLQERLPPQRPIVVRGQALRSVDGQWLSAAADAPVLTELAHVAGCTSSATSTTLVLTTPLSNPYDPQTVVVLANVAQANQGQTVVQTLGSGDAARPNQSFALTNLPLTFESADNAAGLRSTLTVRVGGVAWQPVDSFRDARADDRVYLLRQDLSGRPVVTFGDGVHGARLPTGNDNVVANYRSGLWTTPLEPGQLSLPRTRPLGVKAVTNPFATTGATPPESLAELRERAPRATRPLGRIVSAADVEDFVLAFPGISRARLARFAAAGGALLQVTVAGIDGAPMLPESDLARELQRAIESVRVPGPVIRVDSFRAVLFVVEARVRTDPDRIAAVVLDQAEKALAAAYEFAHSRFGEVLSSSEITTTLMEVPGVVDVELVAFHPSQESSDPPTLPAALPVVAEALRARLAHWQDGELVPAELLLIDTDAIVLTSLTP